MTVRAKAPLRISFAGGGTDIAPYPQEHGGVVLSTTINRYAYASLAPRPDQLVIIRSLDYALQTRYHLHQLLYDGKLDLVKSALLNLAPLSEGLDLLVHSEAPPGSGLGASSALTVATIGALSRLLGRHLTSYDIAKLAYKAERLDLSIQGGMQDQYAAAFGGFNFMEFQGDQVVVTPLRLSADTLHELHYHLLLCYTGTTRLSSGIAAEQQQAYARNESDLLTALNELKAITLEMKNALLLGRIDQFGALLHAGWENKKRLAGGVTSPAIDQLYAEARRLGALGGKILGAGGGGYMLLYCPAGSKHAVANGMEQMGSRALEFTFDCCGLQTWKV